MTSRDTEEGWTLHTTRAGTRNPSTTPGTQNPYDSLRVDDKEEDSAPKPVQTPQTTAPTPTVPTPTAPAPTEPINNTTVDITEIKYITEVNYLFLDTMTESMTTKTIKEFLTKDELKPITKNRTSIDISEFREAVGNALTNITSIYSEEVAKDLLGHPYLVDKLHHFRKRREDATASLPAPQPRPAKPSLLIEVSFPKPIFRLFLLVLFG